ncbi:MULTISPECIES: class I adenylate-forming enzyme family protein [unclassified Sinorhizobium]|uniref:class I adenylate-forming enzyme family protein n=1 Tax=unclassified Sinorhizobium TaxID=2613772 RepID=UPI0035259A4C
MTPIEDLRSKAALHPNRIAFIAGESIWTYRRLLSDVEHIALAFSTKGIRSRDRIVLHMTNTPQFAIALLACLRMGAIAVPLNNRFKAKELTSVLQRLAPTLYIGSARFKSEMAMVSRDILPYSARWILSDTEDDEGCEWPWHADGDAEMPDVPIDINAPSLLLTTSGTTGEPKIVVHTLSTLTAISKTYHNYGLEDSDIMLNASPMVHAGGLFAFLASLYRACPMVIIERFDADAVLDAIEEHRCSWVKGLPFMFAAMMECQRLRPRDVRSLRFCVSGGDVCPAELQTAFPFVFGRPLHSIWASTEASGSLAFGRHAGAVSTIPSDGEVRLVDDAGRPVAMGETGELLVRGPNVSPGYWTGGTGPDTRTDGWLATGDMMRFGEDGDIWFSGRKKNLIIRGGSNISPVEVEQALLTHPDIREAAVFGIPDHNLGERVAAFLEIERPAGKETLNAIIAHARLQLADYKVPEHIEVTETIPRTATGKIDRGALLALFEEIHPLPAVPGHSRIADQPIPDRR